MIAACTTPLPDVTPDAGADANEPVDASEATQLVFEFEADPEIPFVAEGAFSLHLDGVHIELEDVRAIGDTGATAPSAWSLDWNDVLIPYPFVVRGAAPGLYSQLRATVVSYEIYGSVVVDGQRAPFEIVDTPTPSLSVEMPLINCVVEPGEAKSTPVVFDAEEIVEGIMWDDVEPDADGVIRIDANDPAILAFVREHLEESFEYEDE